MASLALLSGLFACMPPNTTGSTCVECSLLASLPAPIAPMTHGTVFTIVIENHSASQIFGSKNAPFITKLAAQGAIARGYHDSFVHPSEANYLWMAAGQNFDVLDDDDPVNHHLDSKSHIADQIEAAGLTWKSYQESMGAPCGLKSHGRYAAKHNPFVFFNDVNGWNGFTFTPSQRCTEKVVDYSQLDKDIAANTVPNYVFITPNLDHDMHDGSIHSADKWLAREIPKIMASQAYQNNGVIFLLADEGGGIPAADDPPFLVVSKLAKPGYVSTAEYDTSSYLKTVQQLLGVAALPCNEDRANVASMDDLFLPIETPPAPKVASN